MADQNITELPIKTNSGVASTDYMLGIDSAEGYQILVRDVAKYIVENYNGSTILGTAQTVNSAFNVLSGQAQKVDGYVVIPANSDLNSYVTPGEYCQSVTNTASTITNKPVNSAFKLTVENSSGTVTGNYRHVRQIFKAYNSPEDEYVRILTTSNAWQTATVGEWIKLPTRAEITELNSKTAQRNVAVTEDLNEIKNTGNYSVGNSSTANWPFTTYGVLFVRNCLAYVEQYAVSAVSQETMARISLDGGTSWRSWKTMVSPS